MFWAQKQKQRNRLSLVMPRCQFDLIGYCYSNLIASSFLLVSNMFDICYLKSGRLQSSWETENLSVNPSFKGIICADDLVRPASTQKHPCSCPNLVARLGLKTPMILLCGTGLTRVWVNNSTQLWKEDSLSKNMTLYTVFVIIKDVL